MNDQARQDVEETFWQLQHKIERQEKEITLNPSKTKLWDLVIIPNQRGKF